jgi:hypothetical protein
MDMSLVSCLYSNTMSSVGWYVDSGALRHMKYDKSLFNEIWEQEGGMSVDLGDVDTYHLWEKLALPPSKHPHATFLS